MDTFATLQLVRVDRAPENDAPYEIPQSFFAALTETMRQFPAELSTHIDLLVSSMLTEGIPRGILEPNIFDESDDEQDLHPSKLRLVWEVKDSGNVRHWVSVYLSHERVLLVFDNGHHERYDGSVTKDTIQKVVQKIIVFLSPRAPSPQFSLPHSLSSTSRNK